MALLDKKSRQVITDPLMNNNPITLQVLGICSALAVTVKMDTALVMSAAVVFVLTMSNTILSLMRSFIPSRVRIIVMLAVIASLVILTDQVLRAYMYDMSKQLYVFVGLIITNCIVMGRAEAFATQNSPGKAFLDGFGNALGYGLILVGVSAFREVFGSGTLLGFSIVPEWLFGLGYENNGLMMFPPGAFIILGLIIWVQRTLGKIEES